MSGLTMRPVDLRTPFSPRGHARYQLGAYARVAELVLDEVCRAVGENDNRPRAILEALKRWCDGDRAAARTLRELKESAATAPRWVHLSLWNLFAVPEEDRERARTDPSATMWTVIGGLLELVARAKRGLAPGRSSEAMRVVMQLVCALELLGEDHRAAVSRVRGELDRTGVVAVPDPLAAA